ncbi:probable cytochrome P450 6a21 [Bradysia coprophila]|uniref:probable cytochrome P450 6a21 n=1 Tax=Bradysia coprophila TaxID=38358 RepID=UPI00187DA78E|nr:probable cytochrome P450 6a21 [Bradysia coprophila]
MIVFLTLLVGVVTVSYLYLRHKLNYWQDRGIPCLPPSLLYGNLDSVGQKVHNTINIQLVYENFKIGHKVCGFYLLQTPRLIILDLDLIKNIMIKDFNNFVDRGVYNNAEVDPLSGHLFAIEGDKWRNLRTKLSSTFTSGKMKMMYPIIQSYSQGLVDLVERLSTNDRNGFDIKNVCTRFTADVIGSCGFGLECGALKDENSEMLRMGEFFDIRDPLVRFNFFFVNIFPNFAKRFNMKITPKFIIDFFMPMIRQTYDYRMNNDVNRNDFMSLLIQIIKNGKLNDDEGVSTGSMTFNELAAQAFLFFVAGFETSSTTMTFALYELAYRKEIQDKLRKEVIEIEKRHNGEITYEAIAEMTYLDQIVNETLRIYTPIGQLFRTCINDYTIPDTNIVINSGMSVIIPIHAIHHDSRYFYDPEVFNPDRFSNEELRKRPQCSFLPFGDGPRNCIGMRFGQMQVKLGIATMIKNFEFSFDENTTYPLWMDTRNIVVTAMHPIRLIAKKI